MGKIIFASVISEIQQSDVFMTVKARICEAPQANLNGARVTEAFIDEIVGNEARYVGLPLYADKKALISGNYARLGHLYDTKTGEFHSTQIGSFYKFEKQTTQNGCALIGYARIPKRNKKLSKAISELFADNALKFSFELSVGEYEELDDETILIDASENNYLEGTAIVTYPACEEAVALELVAEQKTDDSGKGEEEMAEVENKAEVVETEAAQPEVAEGTTNNVVETEVTENVAAEEACEDKKETSEEDETAACKKKQAEEEPAKETAEEETAAVVMHEMHEERHTQVAYDTETGKEVSQTVTIETHTSDVAEGTLVQTVDGVHVAEAGGEGAEGGDTPTETPAEVTPEPAAEPEAPAVKAEDAPATRDANDEEDVGVVNVEQKKTAEQMIAELMDVITELKSEIAELKEKKAATMVAEINPFVSNFTTENKYSLLEKARSNTSSYSLLEKY